MKQREASIHQLVCDFLRYQYPDVIFRTDFAAGIKMTMGQAVRHKRMQGDRAYPDLFIAQPAYRTARLAGGDTSQYHGLYLELKREGTTIYLRNGQLSSSKHIREQAATLERLEKLGYRARFAIGFDEAIAAIKEYLGEVGKPMTPVHKPIDSLPF